MYYSVQYGCLTYCPTDVPRTVPSRVRVSSVTDAPHVLSYGYHPYCPTDVTHTVLRMSHLWMSPILSYVYHPYCPTYITHIVLRISHLYYVTHTVLWMSPILSYGCPIHTVLRMSHLRCPTNVTHAVPAHERVSGVTDVPTIPSHGCHTYCLTIARVRISSVMYVTHTVLR